VHTTRHALVTPAHATSYLAGGPEEGPLLVFVHGWPGLGSTWHYQLEHFAARGYRVAAPDIAAPGRGNRKAGQCVHADPAVHSRPAARSVTTRDGGWFGGAPSAPDAPLSSTVLTERDFENLTDALTRNGFEGPTGYYLNHEVNARYANAAPGHGVLRLPVLFVGAAYDQVADLASPMALDAMRSTCPELTEAIAPAGHWLQLEAAPAVNTHIESWLTSGVADPGLW